ncbi:MULTISPECIES: hypothetical protein [unclassified Colwellia]|uniref:hypothetical protein n=1 Tax=unclassified Colwellia TaxID=196834 RepID=UPI0015F57170|nr:MULTISPECIES: hypothetical protein [unclassified Colwellia]MBA6231392.1 hypothetical protein [Colwellia sp. MB02u-7]MBA6235655.1 hypothetical protein [Colwellia sp. MB02u-11]MBA6297921.1 hypothetical protein [Colwellia sp. MB3u-22]MBA6309683.1 hypothetical protein [Colwellia sp. MB3u-64]
MTNSDIFNIVAFEIFHKCSGVFPIPVEFEAKVIAKDVSGYFDMSEDEAVLDLQQNKIFDVVNHTSSWLITEGFLQYHGSSADGVFVTFTLQGLNAINKCPHSLGSKKSFKEILINGLVSVSFSTASGLMVELFKGGN